MGVLGEGKLIERPKIVNVSPGQFETVYATIRVRNEHVVLENDSFMNFSPF
jgi:hypothetical protein